MKKLMMMVAGAVFALACGAVEITVDTTKVVGPVKPVNGVGQPPMVDVLREAPMFKYLKDAGIPYSRLHDVGGWLGGGMYVDIPNVFPNFDADETDPKNYRFQFTDALMRNLMKNGVEPFFRLGVTIENFVGPGYHGFPAVNTLPPKDYAKWARICEHVIRHYTEGWANGYKWNIKYWEIWNEPDNEPDPKRNPMFGGTFEEYMKLYGITATHLKKCFPQLKIGGYASCGFYAAVGSDRVAAANSSPRMKYFVECAHQFLKAARDKKWPLDFFSFHSYSDPKEALRQLRFADELLNSYGFTSDKCERINNEWLPYPGRGSLGSSKQAAGVAAEMLGFQNGPCDLACLYDARCGVGTYSPLFNPMTLQPHKAYYAFLAFNELRKLGTAVSCTSDDPDVFAAAAHKDGKTAVMIANCSNARKPLALAGVPSGGMCRITDSTRTWAEVAYPTDLPPWSFVVIAAEDKYPTRVLELPPKKGNTRNCGGDFFFRKDGSIWMVYSYFTGGGLDHDTAHLRARVSTNGGRTWSKDDVMVLPNDAGMNVTGASIMRLKDGSVALFYMHRNAEKDCRPALRISTDEGKTWGKPIMCTPDSDAGYYCFNNSRVIRLKSGRIVVALAKHATLTSGFDWAAELVCYFSDDEGKTWRRSKDCFKTFDEKGNRVTTQEPGLIELKDGRVLMYARTYHGRQWFFYSSDGCDTWTRGEPGSLWGPIGPASIERLKNGDLIAVWNDHEGRPDLARIRVNASPCGNRVPLTLAISKDEGKTWINRRVLEGYHRGLFCYTAVKEMDGYLLLAYNSHSLSHWRVTTVPLSWMYENVPPFDPKPTKPSAFTGLKNGMSVTNLVTALGTWTAEPGSVTISGGDYHRGVRIRGDRSGKKHEVTLTLPKPAPSDELKLLIERSWVMEFEVEARTEDGTWHTVYELTLKDPKPKGQYVMPFKKLPKPVTAYRFRALCPYGVTIADVDEFSGLNAYFND